MLYVIGAGGHGRVILDAWRQAGGVEPDGFLDDDTSKAGTVVDGVQVVGLASNIEGAAILIGLGAVDHPRRRVEVIDALASRGCEFPPIVHPSAIVARGTNVPRGCVLLAGVIVNRGAVLGEFSTLYSGSILEHDAVLGTHSQAAPAVVIAGGTIVGKRVFVGMGARIAHSLRIGDDAVIGAGSVVLRDIPAGARMVGVPARRLHPSQDA